MNMRVLDACLRPEHLPVEPAFAVFDADFPEAQNAAVQRLIQQVFPRALEHLMLAPETWATEERRGLWLWGLLNVSAARDGTDVRVEHVCRDVQVAPFTATLTQPIGATGFAEAFAPVLAAEAEGCGLSPEALDGPAGKCIRGVLVRTFHRCVDWKRLRRSVLSELGIDSPADGIIRFEPFDMGWTPGSLPALQARA
jgi:hypothetical protein